MAYNNFRQRLSIESPIKSSTYDTGQLPILLETVLEISKLAARSKRPDRVDRGTLTVIEPRTMLIAA
jgi:hypothetical protein